MMMMWICFCRCWMRYSCCFVVLASLSCAAKVLVVFVVFVVGLRLHTVFRFLLLLEE